MTFIEFNKRLARALILCDGWLTKGPWSYKHEAKLRGIVAGIHLGSLSTDCRLLNKTAPASKHFLDLPLSLGQSIENKTVGEVFIMLCDKVGLRANDKGDHFHVEPK